MKAELDLNEWKGKKKGKDHTSCHVVDADGEISRTFFYVPQRASELINESLTKRGR